DLDENNILRSRYPVIGQQDRSRHISDSPKVPLLLLHGPLRWLDLFVYPNHPKDPPNYHQVPIRNKYQSNPSSLHVDPMSTRWRSCPNSLRPDLQLSPRLFYPVK